MAKGGLGISPGWDSATQTARKKPFRGFYTQSGAFCDKKKKEKYCPGVSASLVCAWQELHTSAFPAWFDRLHHPKSEFLGMPLLKLSTQHFWSVLHFPELRAALSKCHLQSTGWQKPPSIQSQRSQELPLLNQRLHKQQHQRAH